MKKRVTFACAAICIGGMAALAFGELAARILDLGYSSAPLVSDPLLHHRMERNYIFTSHTPSGEFGGFKVALDDDGLPCDPAGIQVFAPSRHRRMIALMGDSFVEAVQVPYNQGMCGVLNAHAFDDVFVKGFGCTSYSPVLQLVQWRSLISQQRPAHVVLMLYSNDIRDDETYARLAVKDPEGMPVAVPGPPSKQLVSLLRQSHLARFVRKTWLALCYERQERSRQTPQQAVAGHIEETPEISGVTERCLLRLAKEVREAGAGFTLTAVPSKYEHINQGKQLPTGSFADHVKGWAAAHAIDYLDLEGHFESERVFSPLFFKTDIHFNKEGHLVAARGIAIHLQGYFGPF